MKKDTIEAEVLDSAFSKAGGESSWSVFGARLTPGEIVERLEESGVEDSAVRAVVLGVMLDLVLAGWARENEVAAVGLRVRRLAASWGHRGGSGSGTMPGAVEKCGGWPVRPVAVKVLDSWMWDHAGEVELGKRVLAIGRFFNHAELEGWSVRQLAKAFGESRTWTAKRVRKECNAPIEAAGGRVKATWQQGESQRAKSSEARKESFEKSKKAKKAAKKAAKKK